MTEQKHLIWSDYDLDYEDWRADLEADYPELSEDERMALMHEINGGYLDDERVNLNIQLSRPILVIGDLGLWHGRRMGYKEIESGNIRDCLFSDRDTDYATWYVDPLGDLRCDAIHHDGTNFLLYRAYKDGVRESQIDLLKEKLYHGTATRGDITRITRRLGDEIGKIYGWDFPQRGGRLWLWKGEDTGMDSKALCEHLEKYHKGQENAASSRELEAAFHVKGTELRQTVNRLRCDGHLICSGETGYFYAARPAEVKATIAQLSGRITKIAAAKNGMLKSYRKKV